MLNQPLLYFIVLLYLFFFFSIVTGLQYLFNRDKAFLYYSIYLLVMVAYLGLRTACFGQHTESSLAALCHIEPIAVNAVNILLLMMYYLFAQAFIEYDRYDKTLFRVVRFLITSLFWGFWFDIALIALGFRTLEAQFFIYFSWYITIVSLWCVVKTFMIRNDVVRYIIFGSTFFYVGSVISLYFDTVHDRNQMSNIWQLSFTYEYIGTLFEAICFSVGLSYRSYQTQVEKNKLQAQIIEDLRERQALQQALHTERDRIATEMHDDLGAGLSTLKLLGERAKTNLHESTVQKMTTLSSELIERLVTIIWAMNSQNDSVERIIAYLHRYAFDFLEDLHDLDCQFPFPDLNQTVKDTYFNGESRRRIFLFFKEALHNIIKHAQA